MKGIVTLIGIILAFNASGKVNWVEAKDNMACNVSDATVAHLSNYLIKNKMKNGVESFFEIIGIRYYKDSVVINQKEVSSTDTSKVIYINGEVFTRKGSLVAITDKNSSLEDSTLVVKVNTRELVRYEYDNEGIPTLKVWNCTVSVNSGDLIINFLNQSQDDFLIGNTKIKINETYRFEKVQKL